MIIASKKTGFLANLDANVKQRYTPTQYQIQFVITQISKRCIETPEKNCRSEQLVIFFWSPIKAAVSIDADSNLHYVY